METAIYVYNDNRQKQILNNYGVEVPLYMVYYPKGNFYNSPLYFEMYHPNVKF